jgi:coenzyme F420-reducing hydrogenase delta subunit
VESLKDVSMTFEPEITAFSCIYCGYTAIDTAGALRLSYPANVKIVRLPCTGKMDVLYLLSSFEQGADGVLVVACPLGNCHHVRGNERARARVERVQVLLKTIGLESDRVKMIFVSGGQGATVAREASALVSRVKELGPSPLKAAGRAASVPAEVLAAPAR